MAKKFLSDPASEARRAYQRTHYAKNKDLYKEKAARYWERKAEQAQQRGGERQ